MENRYTKGIIPPKPKRPLTLFNLFCILERNFIIQQHQKRASVPSNDASNDVNTDPYLATRPERYRDVVLPSNWFVVGMNRIKRGKHQVHGVISFHDLTKELSDRWASVDAETKQYCETIAADELRRYRRDVAVYEAIYGKDAVQAQKRTRKTHAKSSGAADNNGRLQGNERCEIDDRLKWRFAEGSRYCEIGEGLTAYAASKDNQSSPACRPFQAVTYARYPGENHQSTDCASRRNGSPTLSEYLPDDQEAALALVGNNYDNILHGEELEKAFDSD